MRSSRLFTAAILWLAHFPEPGRRYDESPEVKNDANEPPTAVITKIAHASSRMSTTRPTTVIGFFSDDETLRTCTLVKKTAWP